MASWTVQLITLLGVALGALASFTSTRLTDRSRWRREERLRWDTKRLECYAGFSAAMMRYINIGFRMAASHGMPIAVEPLDASAELPTLATAEAELSIYWAQMLILGNPRVIQAARDWRHEAWHLESFARGLNINVTEFEETRQHRQEARARYYAAVRADLGVTSGDIPAELGRRPDVTATIGSPQPDYQATPGDDLS